MAFSHPLARGAKVWAEKTVDGKDHQVLVVITTIALGPGVKGFKKRLVEKLSRAAQEYLAASPEATGFVLINRMRDWGSKSS